MSDHELAVLGFLYALFASAVAAVALVVALAARDTARRALDESRRRT